MLRYAVCRLFGTSTTAAGRQVRGKAVNKFRDNLQLAQVYEEMQEKLCKLDVKSMREELNKEGSTRKADSDQLDKVLAEADDTFKHFSVY